MRLYFLFALLLIYYLLTFFFQNLNEKPMNEIDKLEKGELHEVR